MAWQQPKTNWDTHPKAIEPADMNRIEGNIEAVREQSDMALRLETVSSFPAHTPGRVIYHTGNKRAYVSDGAQWIPIGVEGDAVAANVLSGKKFSSLAAGVGVTGTMPNRAGHVDAQSISNSGTILRFRPQAGYYPGDSGNSVQCNDPNWIEDNIRVNVNLFGKVGNLEPLRVEPTSDVIVAESSNTSRTWSTTWVTMKEAIIYVNGVIRISFKGDSGDYRVTAGLRALRNSEIIWSWQGSAGNYPTRTIDSEWAIGDVLKIQGRKISGFDYESYTARVGDLKICYKAPYALPDIIIHDTGETGA